MAGYWPATRIFWVLVIALGFVPALAADAFPNKPIRIIVPFPAGSSADVRTRVVGSLLAEQLKQAVVIDNRPGAAGNVGTSLGSKSSPDGYTLLYINSATTALNPHLYKYSSGFDPLGDLVPIIVSVRTPGFWVVKVDSPIQSVQDLIARAKAKPGKLTYSTSGPGSPQDLMGARLKKLANIDMVAVPYKGEANALSDLMGGQIDCAFTFPPATLPLIQGGKLRALAVTSRKRMAIMPDTPSVAEAGLAEFDEIVWTGFAVPTKTPEAIIKKLHSAFRAAMLSLEFKREVEQTGAELVASTQEYAVQLMKSDYERYGKLVRELNLKVE